jgi:hypothetical protein
LELFLAVPPLPASSLSEYRGFHLEQGLAGVAKQAGTSPEDATVLHVRPALIQELAWRPEPGDSVGQIVFGFYDGELFRMVVGYDRENTEGLTAPDMIDAISAEFGPAGTPSAEIPLSSIYDDNEVVKVLARWEDPSWSFNLVRSKYQSAFFLVALSTRLNELAREAVVEARRLDREEAPQRQLDRKSAEAELNRLQQQKARLENKAEFRP